MSLHFSVRQPSRNRSCSPDVSFQFAPLTSAETRACSSCTVLARSSCAACSRTPPSKIPVSAPRSSAARSRHSSRSVLSRSHSAGSTAAAPRSPRKVAAIAPDPRSPESRALVAKALDSGDLGSGAMAATFLGLRGAAAVEPALWERLSTLREEWRERAAELRGADTGILDGGVREQAAQLERARTVQLEQALVSALVRGANWKLTSGEQDRLREGCLTEKCRDIADGKMSLGF